MSESVSEICTSRDAHLKRLRLKIAHKKMQFIITLNLCTNLGHPIMALNYGTQLRQSITALNYGTQLQHSITALNYGTQLRQSFHSNHSIHSIHSYQYELSALSE